MTGLKAWKMAATFLLCATAAMGAHAQTFTTLVEFDQSNGANPRFGTLVQGVDGNFYGSTYFGGNVNCTGNLSGGCGTIFKITPGGTLTSLYTFCVQTNCPDGSSPNGLVLGTDGNLYGTTYLGGTNGPVYGGTLFKITPEGKLTTLYNFC